MNAIEQLKRYVLQSQELSEPLNYFFDLIDANAFSKIKSHREVKNIDNCPEMMVLVQLIKKEMNERLDKSIKQLTPIFQEIPEHHFFHGICLSVDIPIPLTVIYFSDVKTGIFATAGSQTDMARFSLINPSDSKVKHQVN